MSEELAKSMVESATEWDWDELPADLQTVLLNSAEMLQNWMDGYPKEPDAYPAPVLSWGAVRRASRRAKNLTVEDLCRCSGALHGDGCLIHDRCGAIMDGIPLRCTLTLGHFGNHQ